MLGWGGLRGALSMVLALSLPHDFPHRDMIVTMTFGVVVLSILVQGITMSPLLKALGIARAVAPRTGDAARGAVVATRAALDALARADSDEARHDEVLAALRREYDERLKQAEHVANEIDGRDLGAAERARRLRRRLILVERDALLDAHRRGVIDRRALDDLLRERDGQLNELDSGAAEDD